MTERYRLKLGANVYNLFNQHSAVAVNENVNASSRQLVSPTRASRFSGDPQINWAQIMAPYSYVDAVNHTGAFASSVETGTPMTLASRYGLPTVFQTPRHFRFDIHLTFLSDGGN